MARMEMVCNLKYWPFFKNKASVKNKKPIVFYFPFDRIIILISFFSIPSMRKDEWEYLVIISTQLWPRNVQLAMTQPLKTSIKHGSKTSGMVINPQNVA